MNVEILQDTYVSGESVTKGDVYDVDKADAQTLIRLGRAVPAADPVVEKQAPVKPVKVEADLSTADAPAADNKGKRKPIGKFSKQKDGAEIAAASVD